MRKIAALAGVAAIGLSAQTAFGYSGTASLTFTIGGSALSSTGDQGFVSSGGPISVSSMTNATMFSSLGGANSSSSYNSNFATQSPGDCAIGGAYVPGGSLTTTQRKYGCRYTDPASTALFVGTTIADGGPLAQASGTLTVTDTTLTGTLTIVNTSDEATGAVTTISTAGGVTTRLGSGQGATGFAGFNYRTADGSPFGNVWYGVTNTMTLTVNATGTFTQSSWSITGGSVTWVDPNFACQQGGFGGDARGTLCSASATGGGFNPTGGGLSWGMDTDGFKTGSTSASQITVNLAGGGSVSLAGMIASLSIDASGNVTSGAGEFRRGSGSSPSCVSNITYDTSTGKITCGSLTAGQLSITGTAPAAEVIPVPAAVWLMGSALGLLGWVRRKASA
jgi:hypothetical protein